MAYSCVATSVEGFVQQLACSYLRHGYWWYVSGLIPEKKNPESVDAKLIAKYGIDVSESTRYRRKQRGLANMQYIRYERFFVLLCTAGHHPFREEEKNSIRDVRRVPIKFSGYSISYRRGGRTRKGEVDSKWHSHVQIERERWKELRAHFVGRATHRVANKLAAEFYRIPFEAYAPVRRQILLLWREVNKARKKAGFELLPKEVLPLRRRVVKPFACAGS
jgi:hypothetical protein